MQPYPHREPPPAGGTSSSSRRTGHPAPTSRMNIRSSSFSHTALNAPSTATSTYYGGPIVQPSPSVPLRHIASYLSTAPYPAQLQHEGEVSTVPPYSAPTIPHSPSHQDSGLVPTSLISNYSVNPNAHIPIDNVHIPDELIAQAKAAPQQQPTDQHAHPPYIHSSHGKGQISKRFDAVLTTHMLCIAVILTPSKTSLTMAPEDWALFVRRDAEYENPTRLYSIESIGPGRWKTYNRDIQSLKRMSQLLCVVEFTDSCDWPATQLVKVIQRSQERLQANGADRHWSPAHWVCATLENLGASMNLPFSAKEYLCRLKLWDTVWHAVMVYHCMSNMRRDGTIQTEASGLLHRRWASMGNVWLHAIPEPTNLSQNIKSAQELVFRLQFIPVQDHLPSDKR